ncbi:MAG: glycerol-3-phosphate dehydrogenase, partial [Bacteroidia bacterium]|nr:glycerol-3-phosphate dehydrogenase [Bacteroidia bacterium]
MNSLSEVTVIGGGSWATAIVKMLSSPEKELKIHWWLRNPEDVAYINSHAHNPKYLSDVTIDLNKVHLYSDINMAVSASELVVLAIPSAFFSECFARIDRTFLAGKYFLS